MTEAYPTYDRHFWQTKILTAKDSMDNYREATAAERSAWATAHPDGNVVPERPEWAPLAEAAGAVRHDDRGYWSLNTLDDITDDEMLRIYDLRQILPSPIPLDNVQIRTNLWCDSPLAVFDRAPKLDSLFRSERLEVISIGTTKTTEYNTKPSSASQLFIRGLKLHTVLGKLDLRDVPANQTLFSSKGANFPALRTLKLKNLKYGMNISGLKSISAESLQFWADNSANGTTPITLTVHADVWAKLTTPDIQTDKRIVKAIRPGGVRTFTEEQWVALGNGKADSWAGFSNVSDMSVGDIVAIAGKVSESDKSNVVLYAEITAIEDTTIRVTGISAVFDSYYCLPDSAAARNISFAEATN